MEQYHREKRDKHESQESAVIRTNLQKLVEFLITQKNRNVVNGITSVFVHINENDRTLIRERITITYNTLTGAITNLPTDKERLGPGNFTQYTTDVFYRNQLDAITKDGQILPKTGKPQIFIRISNYSGDLGSSFQFRIPPEETMPFDDVDDSNYFLRETPTPAPSQPPVDSKWIAPLRLHADGSMVPVAKEDLNKSDRTFLEALYQFNENYRFDRSPEEDLFKLLNTKVNIAEDPEKKLPGIRRLLNSIRDRFSKRPPQK